MRHMVWMAVVASAALWVGGCDGEDDEGIYGPGEEAAAVSREGELAQAAAPVGVHAFEVKDIAGRPVRLAEYRGKVLLVVNVASKCGYTKQYEPLEVLYEKYKDRGLVVLAFPANNFGGQEPGTNEEIRQFCTNNYRVTFPLFAKISVKGEDIHPLYAYLTDESANAPFGGAIQWNFNKFLIGRDGRTAARFGSPVDPMSEELTAAVEKALGGGIAQRN